MAHCRHTWRLARPKRGRWLARCKSRALGRGDGLDLTTPRVVSRIFRTFNLAERHPVSKAPPVAGYLERSNEHRDHEHRSLALTQVSNWDESTATGAHSLAGTGSAPLHRSFTAAPERPARSPGAIWLCNWRTKLQRLRARGPAPSYPDLRPGSGQMINASNSIMAIPITSTASATGS
jgi:hypothetical protein